MREDIVPGAKFPDYQLTGTDKKRHKLSELQGIDPMVLVLARGHYCPRDHQQHLELVALYPKINVAYTRIVTISTDAVSEAREFKGFRRRAVALPLRPRAQDPERARDPGVHGPQPRPDDPAHARARTGPGDPQDLQRLLVLGAPVAGGSAQDPPGLGSGADGLREAWASGDTTSFWPYEDEAKSTAG
jgi:hypothetical protein